GSSTGARGRRRSRREGSPRALAMLATMLALAGPSAVAHADFQHAVEVWVGHRDADADQVLLRLNGALNPDGFLITDSVTSTFESELSRPGHAEGSTALDDYKRDIADGNKAYQSGDCGGAIKKFRTAVRVVWDESLAFATQPKLRDSYRSALIRL